ncbi:uncharacterized protein BO97DRAFT_413997 [Aspergillus homomorphus CBS 101889]|uniref:Uncharacterized protein n=1 Tax=Aspergillus homomorphus (strain CBS 101889) TaxID=1450537 RepID=A0A395HXI4_ASPHC|nr:hypothetical protein BO97DRAFT_413997 [Aspergillus homomorphus CBS 101889]RAL12631.1 hypothetical protein BO97DRAFT_413997 [Aspergillus homomorphus CBS 101889]
MCYLPLPLHLYEDWDDEDDLAYKTILANLVNGELTPSEAAHQLDIVFTQEFTASYNRIRNQQTPSNSPPRKSPVALPTSARSQDGPMALRAMPLHHVMYLGLEMLPSHSRSSNCGRWLGTGVGYQMNFDGSYLACSSSAAGCVLPLNTNVTSSKDCAYLHTKHEQQDEAHLTTDEKHIRWRNFQSQLPGTRHWILWTARPSARWRISFRECEYVYAQCKRRNTVTDPLTEMWSMERWTLWKQLFADIVTGEADQFALDTRQLAKLAHERMVACEEADQGERTKKGQ